MKAPQIRLRDSRERDAAGGAWSPSVPTECMAPQPPKILTLEPARGLPGSPCWEAVGRREGSGRMARFKEEGETKETVRWKSRDGRGEKREGGCGETR